MAAAVKEQKAAKAARITRPDSIALASPRTCTQESYPGFYARIANGLKPDFAHVDIGDAIKKDLLGRTFDGTSIALRMIFRRLAKGDKHLDKYGLLIALRHQKIMESRDEATYQNNVYFNELYAELSVLSHDSHLGIDEDTFISGMRFLRVGGMAPSYADELLIPADHELQRAASIVRRAARSKESADSESEDQEQYDGNSMGHSIHEACRMDDRGVYHVQYDGASYISHNFEKPMSVEQFKSLVFEPPTPGVKQGTTVYWTHAHRSNTAVLLALGQRYEMTPAGQYFICNLKRIDAQIEAHYHSVEAHAKGPAKGQNETNTKPDVRSWDKMVVPCIHLSRKGHKSLTDYRRWQVKKQKGEHPPELVVQSVHSNLAVFWHSADEDEDAPSGGEVVSVSSPFEIIGSLHCGAPAPSLRQRCSFCLGRRGKDSDTTNAGYTRLPTNEKDADEEDPLTEEEQKYGSNTARFCNEFSQINGLLQQPYSRLRLGSYMQLVTRIVLSQVMEYLDVLELYRAGMNSVEAILNAREGPSDKNETVEKLTKARVELARIYRSVDPLQQYVMPQLGKIIHSHQDDEHCGGRIVKHQFQEIENILRQFLPECKTLMDRCTAAVDEYDRRAQDKVNNILNILTFITFLVMPMQILTGLYGMNFKKMPELDLEHGYYYFWLLVSSGTVLFAMILMAIYRVAT